jgi:hypothetical protein
MNLKVNGMYVGARQSKIYAVFYKVLGILLKF